LVVDKVPWAPPWWCTPGSSASFQKVSMVRASGLAPHSRVVPACGICSVDTKVWLCNSSNPQWGRGWCTRNPDICRGGLGLADFHLGLADFHSPWDQGHVGEEAENPCHSLPKIFLPCSLALDPSSEGEGVVPPCSSALDPSLEEEGVVPCSSALDPSLEEEGVVPCSSALDPSPEEEGIVPPSLEGEGGDLEGGFPAALLWLESSASWSPAWDLASQ